MRNQEVRDAIVALLKRDPRERNGHDFSKELSLGSNRIYRALAKLEADGQLTSELVSPPGWQDQEYPWPYPKRRVYRLA